MRNGKEHTPDRAEGCVVSGKSGWVRRHPLRALCLLDASKDRGGVWVAIIVKLPRDQFRAKEERRIGLFDLPAEQPRNISGEGSALRGDRIKGGLGLLRFDRKRNPFRPYVTTIGLISPIFLPIVALWDCQLRLCEMWLILLSRSTH